MLIIFAIFQEGMKNTTRSFARDCPGIRKLSLFFCCFLSATCLMGQAHKKDSLLDLIETAKIDSQKVRACYQLSEQVRNSSDSSLYFLRMGYALSQKAKDNYLQADGLNLLADYWYDRGQADSCLSASKKALALLDTSASRTKAKAYSNHGRALMLMARYDESVEWHLKSLAIAEKMNITRNILGALNNLGVVFMELNDPDKALSYYKKALNYCEGEKYEGVKGKILDNIALILKTKGDLTESLHAFEEALEIANRENDLYEVATVLNNMGLVYDQLGELDEAKERYLESGKISHDLNDDLGVYYAFSNLAIVETKLKNYSHAIHLLDSSLSICRQLNYKEGMKNIYEVYAFTYASMNNFEAAYENKVLFEAWKDSVANERHLNKIRELEAKYEAEKKQKEILALSEENLKKEASLAEREKKINQMSTGGIVLVLLLGLAFVVYRQRSRLAVQEKMFNAVTQAEINEQQRIARDLHDSIGAMLAAVINQLSEVKNLKDDRHIKDSMKLLSQTGNEVRRISHNMMPEDLSKFGLVSALQSLVDTLRISEKLKMEFSYYQLERIEDDIKKLHIYRIIQELLQNIVKHAEASYVALDMTMHREKLNIILHDNGKGFDGNDASSDGIGLRNIRSRVDYMDGKFLIDSQPGGGTTVVIDIPESP